MSILGREVSISASTKAVAAIVGLMLRNQDRGMTHDFAVPAVAAAMNAIGWDESGDVTFEVPDTPEIFEYVCRPHRLMMRGMIQVN